MNISSGLKCVEMPHSVIPVPYVLFKNNSTINIYTH